MTQDSTQDDSAHAALNELIPWYLNETLDESARGRLERHLSTCSRCRADLGLEREVQARLATQPAVEYMPGASLRRLNATLNGTHSATTHTSEVRSRTPRLALAASFALVAVVLVVVTVERFNVTADRETAVYHTVTTMRARPPQERIRAVFAPAMTLSELQTALDDAQLKIVDGPSEAGVYSLAPTSTRAVSASLERLRQHGGVRFAESSQP